MQSLGRPALNTKQLIGRPMTHTDHLEHNQHHCGDDTTDIDDLYDEDYEADDIDAIIAINDIVIEEGDING